MPKERRYTQYRQDDVWLQLRNLASALKVQVLIGTLHGCSISLLRLDNKSERLRAVILARSSDWYKFSLNVAEWDHGITAVVCGTHDSCINAPVLALDTMRWYKAKEIRAIFGPLQPVYDANDKAISDSFDQARKSHYGHNILIGALLCGLPEATARLQSLPDSTRFRIETELRQLHTRRQGRPLDLGPDPQPSKAELTLMA
jgi:hypothetical protein